MSGYLSAERGMPKSMSALRISPRKKNNRNEKIGTLNKKKKNCPWKSVESFLTRYQQ